VAEAVPVRSVVRELRALTIALEQHADDPVPVVAEALTRIRDAAADGLRLLADPADPAGPDRYRCPDCGCGRLPDGTEVHTAECRVAAVDGLPAGPRSDPAADARSGHTHYWANPYRSCACGEPPPTDAEHGGRSIDYGARGGQPLGYA
jgi:hypothetical protein